MFDELLKQIKIKNLNYRPDLFAVGSIPKSPSTIYIYTLNDNYIVGTTNARSLPSGERKYSNIQDAEKDFLRRLDADEKAFISYKKRNMDYPDSPV